MLNEIRSVEDLIDDLRTALVKAGAVTVTVDGITAGVPAEIVKAL
jgi:cystathionine beta-lyase